MEGSSCRVWIWEGGGLKMMGLTGYFDDIRDVVMVLVLMFLLIDY